MLPGKLFIKRITPTQTESWEYTLSSLLPASVEATKMTSGRSRELFFSARNLVAGTGLLIQCDVGWDGSAPTLVFTTLAEQAEIGDVTAVQDMSELNNSIALFDFTNAKIWYVNKLTGASQMVASSIQVPELLNFQGMLSGPLWDEAKTTLTGVDHWLGLSQNSILMNLGHEEFLLLEDFNGDGSIDTAKLVGTISF